MTKEKRNIEFTRDEQKCIIYCLGIVYQMINENDKWKIIEDLKENNNYHIVNMDNIIKIKNKITQNPQ